jgi:peptidyl-prolyl cis-trans isomerase D
VATSLGTSVVTSKEVVRGGRSVTSPVPEALLTQAFLMPHPTVAGKPKFAAVDLSNGAFALLAVDKVQSGDLSKISPAQREGLRQQMAQAYGAETTRELLDTLKAKSEIKYNKDLM